MDQMKLRELWMDPGLSREDIAYRIGIPRRQMETIAKNIGLPVRRNRSAKTHGVTRERFESVWMDFSLTKAEACFELGIPKSTCLDLCEVYGLPKERGGYSWNSGQRPDPTPDEIRAACIEIQSRWSEEERALRERRCSPTLQAFSYTGPATGFSQVSTS